MSTYDDGESFAAGDELIDLRRVAALRRLGDELQQIADRRLRLRAIRAWQALWEWVS